MRYVDFQRGQKWFKRLLVFQRLILKIQLNCFFEIALSFFNRFTLARDTAGYSRGYIPLFFFGNEGVELHSKTIR